jgi:hypothetical protein
MNKQANGKAAQIEISAVEALKLFKQRADVGVVGAVRFVAGHYKDLTRQDMLEIARKARVNVNTASRQFNEVRQGKVPVPRLRLRTTSARAY